MEYMENVFMALCKVGFVMDKFSKKLELPNNFCCKSSISILNEI
jgi:hypothetical protein